MTPIKNWQEEYCVKFGLCQGEGKLCHCRAELKFIEKVIKESKEEIAKDLEEILMNHQLSAEGRMRLVSDLLTQIKEQ